VDRAVLERSGDDQIVAALDTERGLTQSQFDRLRSLGVNFKTDSPWQEVKRLYQKHPIDVGPGIQYHLTVRIQTPFIGGAKDKSYDLDPIPAVRIATLSSEGYVSGEGFLSADGTVMKTISHTTWSNRVHFADFPKPGPGKGSGASLLEARKSVNWSKREVELRIQRDPSICLGDSEASRFIEPMFMVWKQRATIPAHG
jgi:hypothetical protein